MPTRRVKNPVSGDLTEAEVVEITSERNDPIMLEMADGSVLRIKVDVAEIARVRGTYNAAGDPVYIIRSNNSVTLLEPPLDHAAE